MPDTFIISAVAIYKAPHFTGFDSNNEIGINVSKLQGFSPRFAYLKRYLVPGQNQVQYLLTFDVSSVDLLDPNTLTGVYVEVSGEGVLVDCISVDDFIATADGTQAALTRKYASGIPAFVTPTPSTYCITRLDDGSVSAHSQVSTDYVGQYIGNVIMVSRLTGSSIYRISSYTVPIPINGDVIATC
jgi:hypothetical protein